VPAAFISLVDADRDFYKSATGFGEPLASARELRGPTFCHHAIAGQGPLVIGDTAADPVYREVPTVASLGVAAYVGVPLHAADGAALGSFCAIDMVPRAWSAADVQVLTELAASAEREIALRAGARATERLLERMRAQAAQLEAQQAEMVRQVAVAERERGRVAAVLESISDAFFAVDHQWCFTYVNDRAEQVLLRRRGELLGHSLWEEFPEAVGSAFEREYRRAMSTATPVVFEEFYAPLDTWFAVHAYPGTDGLAVYFQDVTARHVAEAERARLLAVAQQARADAEAASRAKSDFLAVMSHELRTPLNAIGGYAQLMEFEVHGTITEGQREDLGRIRRAQRHLLGLINAILNFARVEAGHVAYDIRSVALDEIVASVEPLVVPQLDAKQLRYDFAGCDSGARARADADKLGQVLLNLLTNAVKFTPAGGRVSVSCVVCAETVEVRVADTGMGIPADRLESVFDPFVQVGRDLSSGGDGVGLGLAISRDLARGMGGDIGVTSTLGEGSTFTVTLPRAA
jgi:signal transduction histidine kinase